MKRIIAAGFAGALIFSGTASAASPAKQIAALQKQVKSLTVTVKKQTKDINTLKNYAAISIAYEFCLTGVVADALQSTWTTIDQASATPLFGEQQTISDSKTCSLLKITRQAIRTPPTTSVFSALTALLSRTSAFRLG